MSVRAKKTSAPAVVAGRVVCLAVQGVAGYDGVGQDFGDFLQQGLGGGQLQSFFSPLQVAMAKGAPVAW